MAPVELEWLPAYRLRELIRSKEVSPVELAHLTLERIERLNPELNAFLAVSAKEAIDSARAAESRAMSGETLGPLDGIPIPIKDIEEVAGVRHTSGSLVFKDRVATGDSLAVERIRAAGAVIVGKTNTSEFGQIGTCENLLGDACRNPWDTSLTSGASSACAAVVVAAGITAIAQGGDGGGSIRIPAGFCGVYGIKPSQGRVPRRHGGLDSWRPVKFAQVGPLSRSVRDAAILLQVLAGPAEDGERDAIQSPPPDFVSAIDHDIKGLRVAWSRDLGGVAVDPAVAAIAEDAARSFGRAGATAPGRAACLKYARGDQGRVNSSSARYNPGDMFSGGGSGRRTVNVNTNPATSERTLAPGGMATGKARLPPSSRVSPSVIVASPAAMHSRPRGQRESASIEMN